MSHKMGEDEALERLICVLAESCASVEWNDIWSKYQDAYEAEAAEIRAHISLEEEEEGNDNDGAEASKAVDVEVALDLPPSS